MRKGVFSSVALTLVLSVASWSSRSGAAASAQPGAVAGTGTELEASAPQPAAPAATAGAKGVITCSQFAPALRRGTYPFRTLMQTYSAEFTGANQQSIRYLAVQPGAGAKAYPTVVFFNGTSTVAPDWPAGMLASASSSLCQHAALVFFDYPGIGGTTYPGETAFTFDQVSATVYDLLSALKASGALTVSVVDPAGWSLGTAAALKFAVLAAHNQSFKNDGMSIGKLFLIAVKSGGDLQSSAAATPLSCGAATASPAAPAPSMPAAAASATYYPATGNQAMCATSVLNGLLVAASSEDRASLAREFAKLSFPYVYKVPAGEVQAPYGAGEPATICAATVSSLGVVSLCNLESNQAIESECDAGSSTCTNTLALLGANREESPYLGGISAEVFSGEREMSFHFDYASCSSASATSWQSAGCQVNSHQTGDPLYNSQLVVDGSPCRTVLTASADATPTIRSCPGISTAPLTGAEFYVWSGEQDLLIRHDYGQVLCTWLTDHNYPCTYNTFPNAGHGVLYSAASTIYQQIVAALSASTRGAAR
jgi:pimeloyl-ACP methyl ester carboxylesterase